MRARFVLLSRAILASLIVFLWHAHPVQAAKLWQLLETAQKDCPSIAESVKAAGIETNSETDFESDCAGTITTLYLKSLRHRDQQQILQTAIKEQRTLVGMTQSAIDAGHLPNTNLLVAEIELKRLQLLEAQHVTARRHLRIIFGAAFASDPAQFILPVVPAEVWPEDQAAALTALSSSNRNSQAMRQRLKHAWADFEGAQRHRNLLLPMAALGQDLANSALGQFQLGRIRMPQLSDHMSDAVQQNLALVAAENDLVAAQLRVLAILGRTGSID